VLRPKAGTVFVPATAFYTISAPRWNWTLPPSVLSQFELGLYPSPRDCRFYDSAMPMPQDCGGTAAGAD